MTTGRFLDKRSCDRVDDEDAFFSIYEWFDDVDQFLGLRGELGLRRLDRPEVHIGAGVNGDDVGLGKDGGVVVEVVGDVANLGPRYGVDARALRVGGES